MEMLLLSLCRGMRKNKMKLAIASLFTLGVLFAFLAAVIAGFLYTTGYLSFTFLIAFTAVIFFLQWILSPYISDIIFRWLYGMKFVKIEGLREKDSELAGFVERVCKKNKIKTPRIGFINDDNPQAFCYGSGTFNARMVFTQGILTYLDKNERKAVFGHELGHIVHRDFIVMTLAAFILSLLYHFSRLFLRSRAVSSEKKGKGEAALIAAAVVSYVLYVIGTYVVLYLSRVREYFADEFSAKEMDNTDYLSSALIKISYGIIARPESKKRSELLEGTRSLGIMDVRTAKGLGLAYTASQKMKSWKSIDNIFLFDLYNPWAFLLELKSTHPLTAKRIRRLSEKVKDVTMFDFDEIQKHPKIDRKKLYEGFAKDLFFTYMPSAFLILFLLSIAAIFLNAVQMYYFPVLFASGFCIFSIAKTFYRYTGKKAVDANTLGLMQDIYASPIRGIPVILKGEIIGRGVPGFVFSEDMMFQDKTGLIYMNYESGIPVIGNIIFALSKVKELVGKDVVVEGWFLRGLSSHLELKSVKTSGGTFKSWAKFWFLAGNIFVSSLLLVLAFVISTAYFV